MIFGTRIFRTMGTEIKGNKCSTVFELIFLLIFSKIHIHDSRYDGCHIVM